MSHGLPEELVLQGGTIRTMDPELGSAEAIGIAGGRIKVVGPREKVRESMGRRVESVNLNGMTVLPGLIDTHPHLLHFSIIEEPLVDITDATSHMEIIERIAVRAKDTNP